MGQLERRALERDDAGGVRDHEAEVDVDDVALCVDEDVAVVSVSDLEEVADQRVGCQALQEVQLSDFEVLHEDLRVDVSQREVRVLLLQRVDRDGVWNELCSAGDYR